VPAKLDLLHLGYRPGMTLPADLVDWLGICKSEAIGPGGVFGARPDQSYLDAAYGCQRILALRGRG
jgi:hypothetical protein